MHHRAQSELGLRLVDRSGVTNVSGGVGWWAPWRALRLPSQQGSRRVVAQGNAPATARSADDEEASTREEEEALHADLNARLASRTASGRTSKCASGPLRLT